MLTRLLSLVVALLALAAMLLVAPVMDKLAFSNGGPAPRPTGSETPAFSMPREGVSIDRDPNGQFRVEALVNDQPLRLLVDTGADGLALSEADAQTLGVAPDPSTYRPVARTASGVGYGARVQIDRLEISGRELGPVDALVIQGLGTSLLGRSLLDKVGPVTMSGDHMNVGN